MAESKSLRVAYGEALVELGAVNDKVVVLDADLAHPDSDDGSTRHVGRRRRDCDAHLHSAAYLHALPDSVPRIGRLHTQGRTD